MGESTTSRAVDSAVGAVNNRLSGTAIERGALGDVAGSFPSDTFLWLTLGSIVLSASMKLSGRSKDANFVGEWAPTFMALGIYSKLKKLEGKLSS